MHYIKSSDLRQIATRVSFPADFIEVCKENFESWREVAIRDAAKRIGLLLLDEGALMIVNEKDASLVSLTYASAKTPWSSEDSVVQNLAKRVWYLEEFIRSLGKELPPIP
jgi:hypothetical protein